MACMPPIDPNRPAWQGRIDKVKRQAYNKGFKDAMQHQVMRSGYREAVYDAEYRRGYAVGEQRRKMAVN